MVCLRLQPYVAMVAYAPLEIRSASEARKPFIDNRMPKREQTSSFTVTEISKLSSFGQFLFS